ncbi:MAG: phenylalanine--tRNA ligase subunit beta, partial [Chitinivibrionia bacterium]|nr:phenylalanine--tRNA ligase subunit beta [Chitinivibrionia bacterium]
MKISLNWIKDFVSIPEIDPKEAAVKFTMAACEVEGVEETGGFLKNIVAVKVAGVKPHPDAENLRLVEIDAGATSTSSATVKNEVVCGAPNVEVGKIVPYAKLGTKFPNGFTIEPKKIRGVESCGMLCSQKELGLGDDDKGLLILPPETKIGASIAEIYEIESDIIFDIDNKSITHRPDLWGHYGIAREMGLIFGNPLKNKYDKAWEDKIISEKCRDARLASPVSVEVKENTCCKAYYGLSLDGITVGESPKWLKNRLVNCGLRPINNIVDISNFVMLELGIPNHIFDRDLIEGGKIIIRQAGEQTKFTTLDEIERELLPTDTVVADTQKPLVIAGIMGGANSGVSEKTTRIFIESANWTDSEVRKASTRIGLRTDSSQRYEKSLDSQLLERSLLRITELICEICPNAKVIGKIEKDGKEIVAPKKKTVKVSVEKICAVLGKEIEKTEIIRILQGLDFGVSDTNSNTLDVEVPTYRATKDVEYDVDIIEEIGRIIGYDNITPMPPTDKISPVRLSTAKQTHRKIQDFLIFNANLLETMTYPMSGEKQLEKSKIGSLNEKLVLVNALSKDHDRMRPSIIPSILGVGAQNCKNFDKFGCFEIGREYDFNEKDFAKERNVLGILLFDKKESRFMELVNVLERLLRYLNVSAQIVAHSDKFPSSVLPRNWAGIHPTETVDIKIMGKNLGFATTIHPILAKDYKIKGKLSMAIIDISAFENIAPKDKVKYSPLPKFPGSVLDYTVVADKKITVAEILSAVEKLKVQNIVRTSVID